MSDAERQRLRSLLDAIPVGTDCHDERVIAFLNQWQAYHVTRGHTSLDVLRCTRSASAELLDGLRAALDFVTTTARPDCECDRCLVLRGEAVLRQ